MNSTRTDNSTPPPARIAMTQARCHEADGELLTRHKAAETAEGNPSAFSNAVKSDVVDQALRSDNASRAAC